MFIFLMAKRLRCRQIRGNNYARLSGAAPRKTETKSESEVTGKKQSGHLHITGVCVLPLQQQSVAQNSVRMLKSWGGGGVWKRRKNLTSFYLQQLDLLLSVRSDISFNRGFKRILKTSLRLRAWTTFPKVSEPERLKSSAALEPVDGSRRSCVIVGNLSSARPGKISDIRGASQIQHPNGKDQTTSVKMATIARSGKPVPRFR